ATCPQVEAMERQLRALLRLNNDRPGMLETTWPDVIEAVGFPTMGMSRDEIRRRYGSRVRNTMDYLIRAHLVDVYEVRISGRQPVGILVSLPAGVAQSVQATPIRRRGEHSSAKTFVRKRTRGSRFFSDQVGRPAGHSASPPDPLKGRSAGERRKRGGARAARTAEASTRDRARRSMEVRAALARRRAAHGDEEGRAVVDALPWLAAVPADIVAREAMRLELSVDPSLHDEGRHRRLASQRRLATLALSPLWQHRLAVAGRQLDRYANMGAGQAGAGAAIVIDLVRGDWQDWLTTPPRSLGAIAVCARRQAREWRRHDRARRARAQGAPAHG